MKEDDHFNRCVLKILKKKSIQCSTVSLERIDKSELERKTYNHDSERAVGLEVLFLLLCFFKVKENFPSHNSRQPALHSWGKKKKKDKSKVTVKILINLFLFIPTKATNWCVMTWQDYRLIRPHVNMGQVSHRFPFPMGIWRHLKTYLFW